MTTTEDGFLTADRVRNIYSLCFRPEGSRPKFNTTVQGALLRHTFSVKLIQRYREDIIRMLLSLPAGFRTDERGGGSMMTMNIRGDKTPWTNTVPDVEKLIALGLASGLLSFCAPRDRWSKLPGGVPYVRVDITRFGVSVN
jgi:hypothetical protein